MSSRTALGYKHFYAKDVSTHPSMVSTHQHRFKGNMCKNVETVSTRVKSVSTRVEVFQVDTLSEQVDTRPSSQNSQFEELGQQVDTLKEQIDTGPSSQNSLSHILDSVSTLPPGQVDTLRNLFILKLKAATCPSKAIRIFLGKYALVSQKGIFGILRV
ncbi:hypothetical protein Taro_052583 [Colocasia esculenta]|uniref:Uncharacterized protein n=1 Tax=Colocasia esculenta TaxID=4460 RepID=A0A843XKN8_COLES|nr:hypothetical protein [Colocasia esculenta]